MKDPYDLGVKPGDDWAALILVRVYPDGSLAKGQVAEGAIPMGYIFVIESAKADPRYKMPGGHRKNGEGPLETAVREMRGETGTVAVPEAFAFVDAQWRHRPSGHWSLLYTANVEESEVPWMNTSDYENEGEVPKFFTIEEFYALVRENKFLSPHYHRLVELELILPFGRDKQSAA